MTGLRLRLPRPATGPPSWNSPKLLRRLLGKLPGKLGVLGELLGELLRRLPFLCSSEKGQSCRQSPQQFPQHPEFPRQFPQQSPQQFWGIPARGSCSWPGESQALGDGDMISNPEYVNGCSSNGVFEVQKANPSPTLPQPPPQLFPNR